MDSKDSMTLSDDGIKDADEEAVCFSKCLFWRSCGEEQLVVLFQSNLAKPNETELFKTNKITPSLQILNELDEKIEQLKNSIEEKKKRLGVQMKDPNYKRRQSEILKRLKGTKTQAF